MVTGSSVTLNSNGPYPDGSVGKLCSPVKIFGVGRPRNDSAEPSVPPRTDSVRKNDLVRSITATGTVEPEELVNVGAQVQGMITKFGPDSKGKAVDYGSIVKEGGVLAWIDDSLYAAELRSAQAAQPRQCSVGSHRSSRLFTDSKAAGIPIRQYSSRPIQPSAWDKAYRTVPITKPARSRCFPKNWRIARL